MIVYPDTRFTHHTFDQSEQPDSTLHSQTVKSTFVANRVPGTTPRPEISSPECYLPRSVHTTRAQLHLGQLVG